MPSCPLASGSELEIPVAWAYDIPRWLLITIVICKEDIVDSAPGTVPVDPCTEETDRLESSPGWRLVHYVLYILDVAEMVVALPNMRVL
ncbi:hypothetical protein H9L39_08826 [Fusarium oxysporum f. sp. albedinis]|nr:hypothetical protein H9L39_08826 [Fusarium oxysporum f. sp. albedinis]